MSLSKHKHQLYFILVLNTYRRHPSTFSCPIHFDHSSATLYEIPLLLTILLVQWLLILRSFSNMPPKVRFFHSKTNPEDALFRANKHLGQGEPEKAIKLYTDVLYKLAPASIIALLNRSLAYTCLQLPELAVADAYRAGILANQIQDNTNNGLAKYQSSTKYLRAEKLHVDANELWTRTRRRFVGGAWARTPLSSIVINDIPELEHPKESKHRPFNVHQREVVCLALRVRAVYRLCGALYLCGGGARSDALGLVEDAITNCQGMENWELPYFRVLGNLIIADVGLPWDDGLSDPQGLVSVSKAMRRKQEEEKQKMKAAMRAKTSWIKLANYDYDVYEPEIDKADWQQLLRSWVPKASSNSSPHFVHSSVESDGTDSAYAELRADRDISAGELVLSEGTAANVSTSIPEDVLEDRSSPQRHFFCDTCSSLLVIPLGSSIRYSGTKVALPTPSPPSLSPVSSGHPAESPDTPATPEGSSDESAERDAPIFSQKDSRSKSPPPGSQSPAQPPSYRPVAQSGSIIGSDFMLCCPTHNVPTCNVTCRKAREPFDPGLCHTSIERELRNFHLLNHTSATSLAGRKRECLVDLLFLRIFARAFSTRAHPLQDSDIVLATCGPDHQGYADIKRRWSFLTHVIRPIHYIDQLLEQSGGDQFDHLDKCDGWLINTLISKIDTAMRVSQGPRYAKVFDSVSNVVDAFTPYHTQWADTVRPKPICEEDQPEPWKDKEPWIASIHPIFNLIRVADPAKGEKPNVVVMQREAIRCYAFRADGVEPAIRKGEPLLRAADTEEGMNVVETIRPGEAVEKLIFGKGLNRSTSPSEVGSSEGTTQADSDGQSGNGEAAPLVGGAGARDDHQVKDEEANGKMKDGEDGRVDCEDCEMRD